MSDDKKKLLGCGCVTLAVIGIGGMFVIVILVGLIADGRKASNVPTIERSQKITIPDDAQVQSAIEQNEASTAIPFSYDIPALVGKNIDEVRTILGKMEDDYVGEPDKDQLKRWEIQRNAKIDPIYEWSNDFSRNGYELVVTFNPKTRQVIDLFLGGDDAAALSPNVTASTKSLCRLANLEEVQSSYSVKPVKARNAPGITGLTIIPNKLAHAEDVAAKHAHVEDRVRQTASIEDAKWKTWTTADGKYSVEAKFVKGVSKLITLEKKDGSNVEVQLDLLCPEDQEFIKKRKWLKPGQR